MVNIQMVTGAVFCHKLVRFPFVRVSTGCVGRKSPTAVGSQSEKQNAERRDHTVFMRQKKM